MHHATLLGLLAIACGEPKNDSGDPSTDDTGSPPVEDSTAPTITLTAPLDGASISGATTFSATASDDVGVEQVRFKLGGEELAVLDAEPYEVSWDPSAVINGNYLVVATAQDAAGNTASASAMIYAENDDAPSSDSIRLINPVDGSTICGTVSVEAVVSFADAELTFSLDGTAMAADTSEPYTWDWSTVSTADGSHSLTATAQDADGGAVQHTVWIEVDNSSGDCDNLPNISLDTPEPNAILPGGDYAEEVEISAIASDDMGVTSVQFFVDNGLLLDDTSVPFATTWDASLFDEGPHGIKAIATDTAGQTAETQLTVTLDGTPPEAEIVAPTDGTDVQGLVVIEADLSDEHGIAEASFYANGTLLGTLTEEPWETDWDTTTEPYGDAELQVVVQDMAGLTQTTTALVWVDNPPTVDIDEPDDGDTVEGQVEIEVDAFDDDEVTSVEIWVDGSRVRTDCAAPYSYTWDTCDASSGAHDIEAIASDSNGASANDTVAVTVDQSLELLLSVNPSPLNTQETLLALVSDDEDISSVVFDLDGTVVGSFTSSVGSTSCPLTCRCEAYSGDWNTTGYAAGTYTLTVTATNAAGETASESGSVTIVRDADSDGYEGEAWGGTDCDDDDASVHPGATEACNGQDDDCDGVVAEDMDGDGDLTCGCKYCDCDDNDATVHWGATEVWYDGVDQDCDGASDYDADTDGYDSEAYGGTDCDDADGGVHPGAADAWYDGVDANCDGASDYDADGDGYDADAYSGTDCDDGDATINPAAADAWYDGVDANCDGASDYDGDGDGYDAEAYGGEDCDDSDASINPGATEIDDDGTDQNCDGADIGVDLQVEDLVAGDLLITEIMKNPSAVADDDGEWFEVLNASGQVVNLDGLQIYDAGSDFFTVSGAVIADVDTYLVFGKNSDDSANGGVTVDYDYDTMSLANGDDEVILANTTEIIDGVFYEDSSFPDSSGVSATLDPNHFDVIDNDDGANWCDASSAFGDGDLGTPGVANDSCL